MIQLIEQINISGNKSLNLNVFIDLAKAIDIVEHKILVSKSNNDGANNYNLYWFQRYLIQPKLAEIKLLVLKTKNIT